MTVQAGVSVSDARQIAEGVWRENLIEMHGIARRIVEERMDAFIGNLLSRLAAEGPDELGSLQDPDVQYALYTCQREFARVGRDELGDTLIDLLVDRCGATTSSLRAMTLNGAIEVVGRLTGPQIDALTTRWLVTSVRATGISTQAQLFAWLQGCLCPFVGRLPKHRASYDYLMSVGCATIQVTEVSLGKAWSATYPGLFPRGLTLNEIPVSLQDHPELFAPHPSDESKLQVRAINAEDADKLASQAGLSAEVKRQLVSLLNVRVLADKDVVDLVVGSVPALKPLAEAWTSTPLRSLRLSTVGSAIAHSNWRRVTGGTTDLSIWIPDLD